MVVALVPALVLAVGLEYEAVAVPLTPVLWLVGLALSGMVVLEPAPPDTPTGQRVSN